MPLRILIVEDEYLIALDEMAMLTEMGAEIVGPADSVKVAMELAEAELLDAAVLDARLGAEAIDPVAELLDEKGVPFLFAVGNASDIDGKWPNRAVVRKPFSPEQLRATLEAILPTGKR